MSDIAKGAEALGNWFNVRENVRNLRAAFGEFKAAQERYVEATGKQNAEFRERLAKVEERTGTLASTDLVAKLETRSETFVSTDRFSKIEERMERFATSDRLTKIEERVAGLDDKLARHAADAAMKHYNDILTRLLRIEMYLNAKSDTSIPPINITPPPQPKKLGDSGSAD